MPFLHMSWRWRFGGPRWRLWAWRRLPLHAVGAPFGWHVGICVQQPVHAESDIH